MNRNYEELWKKVQKYDEDGLPQSALAIVDSIYSFAKTDKNQIQQIKAIVYRAKYSAGLDEDGVIKSVELLESDLKSSDHPVTQSVLHSLLAELYSNYFNSNLWEIKDRTATATENMGRIDTWSTKDFLQKIRRHYLASVQDPNLKTMTVSDYVPILTDAKKSDSLRPFLYDILAHRAIDYFENGHSNMDLNEGDVIINDPVLFAHTDQFIEIHNPDTSTFYYSVIELFKSLESLHRKDANPAAWIDVVKKRLHYAYLHFQGEEKDKLYEAALDQWIKLWPTRSHASGFMLLKANLYATLGRQYQVGNPDTTFKMYLVHSADLFRTIIKNYKGTPDAAQAENMLNELTRPAIGGQAEKVNLINKPFRILVDYQNSQTVFIKVVPISASLRQEIYAQPAEKTLRAILNEKVMFSSEQRLPAADDLQHHSVEIKIDGLPVGMYAIILSNEGRLHMGEDVISILYTHVSNLAYLHTLNGYYSAAINQTAKNEFIIADRESGSPIYGVKASFFENQYQPTIQQYHWILQSTALSDINGKVDIDLPKNKNFSVKLEKEGNIPDQLWLDDGFSNSSYYQDHQRDIEDVIFFLDRSIYRPGQIIFFKGLAVLRDSEGKVQVLKKKKIDISMHDANGQEVIKKSFTSNDFGSFNGSFIAPINGLAGSMSLISSLNQASVAFNVEEYKRPKFEVLFDTIKVTTRLNESITSTGYAKNLAGNAIDHAKVKYKVSRQRWIRPMPWWYWKGYYPMVTNPQIISQGTLETDRSGKFSIPFTATPEAGTSLLKDEVSFIYTIDVDITDFTGETRSASSTLRIGNINLILNSSLNQYEIKDSLKAFTIHGTDLNGEAIEANGKYTLSQLTEPSTSFRSRYWTMPDQFIYDDKMYHGWFPTDIYKDEDQIAIWSVRKIIQQGKFDTKGTILLNNPLPLGVYKIEVNAQDNHGKDTKYEQYFWVESPAQGLFASTKALAVFQDKSELEPNVPMRYTIKPRFTPQYILQTGSINQQSQWISPAGSIQATQVLKESNRGEMHQMHWWMIKDNRFYTQSIQYSIPWTNKDLKIETISFRDKLLPGQDEEWKLKISGQGKDKFISEVVASMYDQSLDALYPHNWNSNLYRMNYLPSLNFTPVGFVVFGSNMISFKNYVNKEIEEIQYRNLNWFGFELLGRYYGGPRGGVMMKSMQRDVPQADAAVLNESVLSKVPPPAPANPEDAGVTANTKKAETPIQPRKNLNETVFFYPEIKSDAEGNFILKFKMNEALTRWRLMLFGHTQDLKSGYLEKTVVTQKDLMVFPNAPRFVRQGDILEFPAKVSNLSSLSIKGNAQLELFDPLSGKNLNQLFNLKSTQTSFDIPPGESNPLKWTLNVPDAYTGLLGYRVIVTSGTASDGEENVLPVLSNRMLVTESYPFQVRAKSTKTFDFTTMLSKMGSTSLKHHQYSLEVTTNPTWYAIQSLPYMMEFPYECTEQIVNRYYANALAAKVIESNPRIKSVFEAWKSNGDLKSPLQKNQELKTAVLEETPWVKDALSEAEQQKMIALLFDINKLSSEKDHIIQLLNARQLSNGGFPWFEGRDDWYITQYIVEALGHLKKLGITDPALDEVLAKAVTYCDKELIKNYYEWKKIAKKEDIGLPDIAVHYLYARSFYQEIEIQDKVAFDYFIEQAEKLWLKQTIYSQGMMALAIQRWRPHSIIPGKILASLNERAQHSDELGMYWKFDHGYRFFELPIETQSMIIEAFSEIKKDQHAVNEMRLWLLKNKQTNHWPSTKATSSAIYALMLNGDDWTNSVMPDITLGNEKLIVAPDQTVAGLGYFKIKKEAQHITKDLTHLTVNNSNNHILWGAAYWQYFEDLDKIASSTSKPFAIIKTMFIESTEANKTTLKPFTQLQVGDKLIVRLEIKVDRPMEYIHLKDMRAAGLEPVQVVSQYKYQGGLGYYESTKDIATHFFFDHITTGTYILEYPLRVAQRGKFSNGISTMQCMYAPEFSGHTQGEILMIK